MEGARLWALEVLVRPRQYLCLDVRLKTLEALDGHSQRIVAHSSLHGFAFLYSQAVDHRHCLYQMDRD